MSAFVTPSPWGQTLQHPIYATEDTYRRAAAWLSGCATVADWGGGNGLFGSFLPKDITYAVVDGTLQASEQTLVNLRHFREISDGILIRHVLDINLEWRVILQNAIASFRRRLAVITFTPDVQQTGFIKMKSGWPVVHFNPDDLRREMGPLLVRDERVQTTHPERIYYLEKAA